MVSFKSISLFVLRLKENSTTGTTCTSISDFLFPLIRSIVYVGIPDDCTARNAKNLVRFV